MRPLAVSMGDPAGVGLELLARIVAEGGAPPFFLIGDQSAFERAAKTVSASLPRFKTISRADEAPDNAFAILHEPLAMAETPGEPDPANARAIAGAIKHGVEACVSGAASGLVTLPIAKASLPDAGFAFPGHTEFIGDLTKDAAYEGERGPVMLLASPSLKVALVTIHMALRDVPRALTHERIVRVARIVAQSMQRDFGIAKPRLALCGLNPHAGEDGELGREEIEIIDPAAQSLRAQGIDATDAQSADGLFHAEARATYDVALAMYHDQGLVASKALDFWGGVNATIGLPIVRTSPDHGTAYALAGEGKARPDSVRAALNLAWEMAQRRAAAHGG